MRGQEGAHHGLAGAVLLVEHEVRRDHAPQELRPLANGPRPALLSGEARVGHQRAGQKPEAQGRFIVGFDGGPGEVRLAAKEEGRVGLGLPLIRDGPEREPAEPLVPGIEVALQVGGIEVAAIRAAHDAERVGQGPPVRRRGRRKARQHARVGEERQEILARQRGKRQLDERRDGLGHGMAALHRHVRQVVRQPAALGEHGGKLREVLLPALLRHNDRDVAGAQGGIAAQQGPNLGGDHL